MEMQHLSGSQLCSGHEGEKSGTSLLQGRSTRMTTGASAAVQKETRSQQTKGAEG